MIYRSAVGDGTPPSPEQMQEMLQQWRTWYGQMASAGQLTNPGNRLSSQGSKTIKAGHVITDGPYVEIKEFISGYGVIKAADIDEAVKIASGCPAINMGGSVEVREVIPMEMK